MMQDMDRRGVWVIAVALAVALVAILYAGYLGSQGPKTGAQGVNAHHTPSPAASSRAASPSPSPSPSSPPRVMAFLGDGWTAGAGTTCGPPCGFAEMTATQMGMKPAEDAVAGTGFSNGGGSTIPGPDTFAARLARFEALKPDFAILAGGQADSAFVQPNVQRAATALIGKMRQELPMTYILVIGPFATSGQPSAQLLATRDVIAAAAKANGVSFVDPIAEQWITGVQSQPASGNAAQYISADGANPTPEGHKYLAQRLVADLRQLKVGA